MFKAVLFDMDGLLFDSERMSARFIKDSARAQGYTIHDDTLIAMLGVTAAVSQKILADAAPGLNVARVWKAYADGMFSLAKQGDMPLKAGARELLGALKSRGIPAAVATSNSDYFVNLYVDRAGIADYFAAIAARDDNLRSKPAPDLFLKAADMLRVPPESCLVLEDSMNGIKAGRAAGMTVCMVPDMIPYSDECAPYCDHVTRSLADVIPLLDA